MHTVAIHNDGTVVATGHNIKGQCNVFDWTDMVCIAASYSHALGLRSDGTVVAAGSNDYSACNVQWMDHIVAVLAGRQCSVGILGNGTATVVSNTAEGSVGHRRDMRRPNV